MRMIETTLGRPITRVETSDIDVMEEASFPYSLNFVHFNVLIGASDIKEGIEGLTRCCNGVCGFQEMWCSNIVDEDRSLLMNLAAERVDRIH